MRGIGGLLLVLFMAGCSSVVEQRDAAPTTLIDLDAIPPVVPRLEPVTMAGNKSPYEVFGKTYYVMPQAQGYSERGVASWYGTKFHGRLTSNGEVYNMYGLTAAHRSLPIPSYVRVRNLENNQEIVVRINDRGPFHDERVIDLSWAAAAKLGFAERGTAAVEVIAIDPNQYQVTLAEQSRPAVVEPAVPTSLPNLGSGAYLQVAALRDQASVSRLLDQLIPITRHPIEIVDDETDMGVIYRVQIGPILEPGELSLVQTMLELGGMPPGFIVYRESCAQSC